MNSLKVLLTNDGKAYDLSKLYRSVSLSGSTGQVARRAAIELLVPGEGRDVPAVPCEKGSLVCLSLDGKSLYYGYIVQRRRTAGGLTMTLECLDRGWQLSGNEGWYSLDCTPEAAAKALCADFGIPVGSLAATGVRVARKFPGVALHRIISTMYSKAAEVTGKRYHVGFDGEGRLCVKVKPEGATGLALAPRVNLSSAVFTEDISSICTSVAIFSEEGTPIRTVDDADAQNAYGLFRHIITQADGGDALGEARVWLADHGESQTVSVECLGDPGLVTGTAVTMLDQGSGARGLFWIDSDKHTWQGGVYRCTLGLNFRNLMSSDSAGREE